MPRKKQYRATTVAQVLLKAAEYIEDNGWCRYVAEDRDGRCCVLGAVYSVMSTPLQRTAAQVALRELIGSDNIGRWNDATPGSAGRAKVLRGLREAAAKL